MRKGLEKLKVLIAEDNEVNQLVTAGILRHWGVETKIAKSGFEAFKLVETEDFDLVLMDVRAPDQSGIEATKEIRKLKDQKKKNIPIIALMANALKGEERKYLVAGMDDYLTKPFKEADLYEVIIRVLTSQGTFNKEISKDSFKTIPVTIIEKKENLYNLKQLEEMASGNREFLASLAKIYLITIPTNSGEMVEASEKADWDRVSKLAHKLKSTVDTMNITSIQTDIRTLEIDAKNKVNTLTLPKLASKVDEIIKQVAILLKEEFAL
jgi:CheY-like chemotaxis protein/HPt (histidine-containing phosphotransfer) domain-containing protein